MQTQYNAVAPTPPSKHSAATTFETKKASKQVNRQDTLFTILSSVSAEQFDLFPPVYPAVSQTQCSVSELQRPIGDRFRGKRSNIHFEDTEWKI